MSASALPPIEAFHASRRMFAIIDGLPVIAEEATTEGHLAWFLRKGWLRSLDDPAFETIIRGYSDGQDLYAYRGQKFLDDALVEAAMRHYADDLKQQLNLPPTAKILLGVMPTEAGKKWSPRRMLSLKPEI